MINGLLLLAISIFLGIVQYSPILNTLNTIFIFVVIGYEFYVIGVVWYRSSLSTRFILNLRFQLLVFGVAILLDLFLYEVWRVAGYILTLLLLVQITTTEDSQRVIKQLLALLIAIHIASPYILEAITLAPNINFIDFNRYLGGVLCLELCYQWNNPVGRWNGEKAIKSISAYPSSTSRESRALSAVYRVKPLLIQL